MEIGFVSSILDGFSMEEMLTVAESMQFECVEVACWPQGKAERRYAGVSHIDVLRVLAEDGYADMVKTSFAQHHLKISALAYYPNTLDPDLEKRTANISHLKAVIGAAAKLGVGMVTTFIGRDQGKTVEANLEIVWQVWPPIVKFAEEHHVKIAIENCPMLFGKEQWPGGQNLMTTPDIWRQVFDILHSNYVGINYDPSHFVWQMMDYIAPLYEFRKKIFHVHCKDIKLYPEKLHRVGSMAYPLSYMAPKLPGLGDVDWGKYFSALSDIAYDGFCCIEVEDRSFEGSKERILDSLRLSKKYLSQYII